MTQICRCPKCGELPNIIVQKKSGELSQGKINCCGFGVTEIGKNNDEALEAAADAWKTALDYRK